MNSNYDSRYLKRGASASKSEVHVAIKNNDKGIFPGAFCKISPDILGGSKDYCNVMHADGAGTKASLAYMYYKETQDISVFSGIAQDSLVMNIDDLATIGVIDNILLSNTIGRNKHLISGEIIGEIIGGYQKVIDDLRSYGINISSCGGETADVGDLVQTLIVDSSVVARCSRSEIINNANIRHGDVIIGLASYGKSTYEKQYNSGIGSNGLTSARHDVLQSSYTKKYPETYCSLTPEDYIYCGTHLLTDDFGHGLSIGQALLSPTRTYTPVLKEIFDVIGKEKINGIIHNTGGGQVKCRSFGNNVHYVKDNIIEVPSIFDIIRNNSQASLSEMFQVFNMGTRMEIILPETYADKVIKIINKYNIKTAVIGHVEKSTKEELNEVTIKYAGETYKY